MYHPNKQTAVLAEDDIGLAKEAGGNLENITTSSASLNTKTPSDPAKESGKLADIKTSTASLVTKTPSDPAKESGKLADIKTSTASLDTKTPSDPAKESGKLANIDSSLSPATDFEGDKITVGTTAVELTFTGTTRSIHIEADHDNSGTIYIGKSNVASDGSNSVMRLDAGEATGWDYDDTTNAIYVIGSAADQVVYKLALL